MYAVKLNPENRILGLGIGYTDITRCFAWVPLGPESFLFGNKAPFEKIVVWSTTQRAA